MPYYSDSLSQALSGPIGRMSMLTNQQGLGVQGYDKSIGQSICRPNTLTRFQLRNLYRQHSIIQRVVNYTGNAGTRQWLEPLQIADDNDSDVPEKLKSYWKRLHTRQQFKVRDRLARQFGGACIFIGVVDGTDSLEEPVNVESIQTISFLKVFDRWELYAASSELSQENPEFYVWYPSVVGDRLLSEEEKRLQVGVKIHKSRVLRQDGVDLPRIDMNENEGWGDSVIQAFIESMLRYEQNQHQVAHMLASHDIFLQQINGLSEILSQDGGLDEVVNLAKENWRMLSMFRTMIQDGDRENSSYVSHSFGGIADTVKISMEDMTARIGLPHHIIWGSVGKAGLADSGGAEKQAENDMVLAYQQDKWLEDLEYLAELTFAAEDFDEEEPEDWELNFKHLHKPTEKEKAEIKELYSRIDAKNIQSGAMTGLEVRERQTSTEFITDLVLPDEPPEELQPDDPLAGLGLTEETLPATAGETGTESEQPPTEFPTEEVTAEVQTLEDSQDFVDLVERFDAQLRKREEEMSEIILAQMDALGRKYSRIIRDNYLRWGDRDLLLPVQQQELIDEIKGLFRFDLELRDEFLAEVQELYRVSDRNGEDMALAYLTGLDQLAEPTAGMTEEQLEAIVLQSSDDLRIQGERFAETAAHTVVNLIAMGATAEQTSRQVRDKLNRSAGDVTAAVETHSVGTQGSASTRATTANGVQFVQLLTENDDRVCPYCVARAYNVYRAGEIQVPFHRYCRCVLVPYDDEFLNQGLSASFFAEDRKRQIDQLGKQPNYGVSPSEKFRGMENAPKPVRRFTQTGDSVFDEFQVVPNTRETAQLVLDILKGSYADRIRSITELTVQYDPDTDQLVANGVFVGDLGLFDFTIDTAQKETRQIQYQLQNAEEARRNQVEDTASVITDAKKCTKGFSCGNSCQAIGRACLVGLTADQKKQVNALKGAARAALSQELQAARTAEQSAAPGVPADVKPELADYYNKVTSGEITDEDLELAEEVFEEFGFQTTGKGIKAMEKELGVSNTEAAALKGFLSEHYTEMNRVIWAEGGTEDEAMMAVNAIANSTLKKVPPVEAESLQKLSADNSLDPWEPGKPFVRGVDFDGDVGATNAYTQQFKDALNSGQPHTNMLLMSTSYDGGGSFEGNVSFQITPKVDGTGAGRVTDPYKNNMDEREVTYPAGTQFKVTAVRETETVGTKDIFADPTPQQIAVDKISSNGTYADMMSEFGNSYNTVFRKHFTRDKMISVLKEAGLPTADVTKFYKGTISQKKVNNFLKKLNVPAIPKIGEEQVVTGVDVVIEMEEI